MMYWGFCYEATCCFLIRHRQCCVWTCTTLNAVGYYNISLKIFFQPSLRMTKCSDPSGSFIHNHILIYSYIFQKPCQGDMCMECDLRTQNPTPTNTKWCYDVLWFSYLFYSILFSHSVMRFRSSSSILYDYEDAWHAYYKRLSKNQRGTCWAVHTCCSWTLVSKKVLHE